MQQKSARLQDQTPTGTQLQYINIEMSAWQKAGISFNKYLAIAARTVQKSLKNEFKVAAEKRYVSEAKVQKLEKGNIVSTTDLGVNKTA
ncbi:hypothetical protein OGAPHI_005628 [Ogataea philodendri]|uniref:Uncharacterized protein n=2 Tax=Ogataea TaxID=461281 RepID=A0A9P8T256_9ASCO|nr:uncharacterized protein OGAPHI_005628 [Ogataea philodendri]KAH3662376.1 hypothetical protein OGAPHI_005628 [Ogataea philodendri]